MSDSTLTTSREAARDAVTDRTDVLRTDIVALSRSIHADPEVGFEETRAVRRVADATRAWTGVDAEIGVAGLPTALRAEAGGGPFTVTLCAEYDALPGIGHACGHNIIAAAATGAFALLAPIADELGMTVRLLGTPAEENGGGKITLLDAGAFDGTSMAMMVHPGARDSVAMSPFASAALEIEFTGRETHASASPHDGVNALDALTIMLTAIGLARQQLEPEQQIHGFVRHAGTAPNIIPGAAGGTWMARAATLESLQRAIAVIRRCAEAGALGAGARVSVTEGDFQYADLVPDQALNDLYGANARHLGRTPNPAMPRGGSTDMGNVSHRFPSIHPMVGIGDGTAGPHTEQFVALAGGDDGDRAAVDGALLLALTAIDAATDPVTRERLLSPHHS